MKNKILPYLLFLSISVFANDTCIEFCGSCMGKSDSPACAKVELLCKCSEMISSLKDEISEVPSDTVTTDSIPADTAFVDTVSADTLQAADSTADTMVVDTTALPAKDSVVKDTVVKDTTTQEAAPDTSLAIIAPTTPQHVEVNSDKKERIFYKGVSIGFEQFLEYEVANHEVKRITEFGFDHVGVSLGFLLRWYFYRWGSFQTGLNTVYHHADYYFRESGLHNYNADKGWGELDYHSILLEVPLQFRFGFPIGKTKEISPFASISTLIRKPIYAWIPHYYADWSWENRIYDDYYYGYDNGYNLYYTNYNHTDNSFDCDGAFTIADWEFLEHLGFGIEFYRHFSIQWQILLISLRTNVDEIFAYVNGTATWRISMDFAW
ncbi:MAG: hypothetical protein IKP03_01920 [Fibrobacter sp.]|nr:hypothetical protein [Fibrobacter sp.]